MLEKDFLLGTWHFKRIINDKKEGGIQTASGTCWFYPQEQDLVYYEKGSMVSETYEGDFFQTYLYRFPTRGSCQVFFKDGRLFYEVSQQDKEITHRCGDDLYRGRLIFKNSEIWQQSWIVKGPRKNYSLLTEYNRQVKT